MIPFRRASVVALATIALAVGSTVRAEVLTFAGRAFILVPPAGYCALGTTAAEKSFLEEQKALLRPRNELLQASVPCAHLKAWNAGKLDTFSRWAQVQIINNGPSFKPITLSRTDFIATLSKRFKDKPVDMALINKRMQEILSGKDMQLSASGMQVVGTDERAAYVSMSGQLDAGGVKSAIVMFGGITLVKQMPLGVYAYEKQGAPAGEPSTSVAPKYLQAVLEHN